MKILLAFSMNLSDNECIGSEIWYVKQLYISVNAITAGIG
jgi:hypothetical protein